MATKLLLVDDDSDLRALLGGVLADAGYAVTEEGEPQRVTELLARTHFDAVVCDQRLGPGVQGTGLLDEARRRGLLEGTRCILISGLPPTSDRPWLQVLQKPFDVDTLVRALQSAARATTAAALDPRRDAREQRRSGARPLHELNDALLDTELEAPLRLRIERELEARRARSLRSALALELGRATRQVGDVLREQALAGAAPEVPGGGEAVAAALNRLEAEASTNRKRLDELTVIAHRMGVEL